MLVPAETAFAFCSHAVCVFYLVLRALDTLEDDMTICLEKKVPLLQSFHTFLYDPDWRYTESKDKHRQVLEDFPTVGSGLQALCVPLGIHGRQFA